MAVYTHIDEPTLREFLKSYDFGELVSFAGIEKGVSNTNYRVETATGPYILTIFEPHRVVAGELPFFFALSAHIAGKGIACPQALAAKNGKVINTLYGKPASIINFLQGTDVSRGATQEHHCAQIGEFLARMHQAVGDFHLEKKNEWGPERWSRVADHNRAKMNPYHPGLEELIDSELAFIKANWPENLPKGAIHADLFPDNVFFQDDKINAVIDFYFACTEFFVFDLAIVIDAWCFDENREFRKSRYDALMKAYESVRPLSADEKGALHLMLRGTSLRYLVSRLEELFNYKEGMLTKPHDPMGYVHRLIFHRGRDVTRE